MVARAICGSISLLATHDNDLTAPAHHHSSSSPFIIAVANNQVVVRGMSQAEVGTPPIQFKKPWPIESGWANKKDLKARRHALSSFTRRCRTGRLSGWQTGRRAYGHTECDCERDRLGGLPKSLTRQTRLMTPLLTRPASTATARLNGQGSSVRLDVNSCLFNATLFSVFGLHLSLHHPIARAGALIGCDS